MSYFTGIGGLQDVATMTLRVADDPALPEVISLVSEIKAVTSKGPGPSIPERGVGLKRIVTPLRGFVAYKKHPWILPALAGGVIISIFALGMLTGKRRKS